MNPVVLYFLVFIPTLIIVFVVVITVRALMVQQHANIIVKRIAPESNKMFQDVFKNICFSYTYSKGNKVNVSSDQQADLYWSGPAFVLICEKKFMLLGSWLPMVFAVSTNPYKTKEDFSDLDVYGLASVKTGEGEVGAALTLKSATKKDVSIVLRLKNLNSDQLAHVRRLKR